jgi:hypothetical protein
MRKLLGRLRDQSRLIGGKVVVHVTFRVDYRVLRMSLCATKRAG